MLQKVVHDVEMAETYKLDATENQPGVLQRLIVLLQISYPLHMKISYSSKLY